MGVTEQVLFNALAQEKNKKNKLGKNGTNIPEANRDLSLTEKTRKPKNDKAKNA